MASDSGDDFARYGIVSPSAGLFALNVWGLAAAAVFGLVIANPFAWLNGKRLIFGCMAFAGMLGRMASSALPDMIISAPIYGLVKFVATPFVLLLGGAFSLLVIAFVIAAGFGFFVGLPVMVFNQILTFDNALHVYRHQARGLAGYIVRAIFWLRNEPMPDAPPDDSKGARMATMKEIQALHKDAPESMAFGHPGSPLLLKTDKHVLIIAGPVTAKLCVLATGRRCLVPAFWQAGRFQTRAKMGATFTFRRFALPQGHRGRYAFPEAGALTFTKMRVL